MNVCDLLSGEPCGGGVQRAPTAETVLASDSNGRITEGMPPRIRPCGAHLARVRRLKRGAARTRSARASAGDGSDTPDATPHGGGPSRGAETGGNHVLL